MEWNLLAEQVGASLHQLAPSHSVAAPGHLALLAVQPRRPPARRGLGRRCSSGAAGTAAGAKLPGHLTLAKVRGLHSHHVPMCQVDWACCFWNAHPPRHPERGLCDVLVSEPKESHRAAVFLGTDTQRAALSALWLLS